MAATNHSWTIADTGCANGPAGEDDTKPGGYIEIPFGPTTEGDGYVSDLSERFDVPYEYDFHKMADISGAPDRVDVPDPVPGNYGVPNPGAGTPGQPIDFNAVAPDFEEPVADLDGSESAPASGTGVLFRTGGSEELD